MCSWQACNTMQKIALLQHCCMLKTSNQFCTQHLKSILQSLSSLFLVTQALLTAMRLGSAAKQPWLVGNSAITIWNTYLPNLQQQRFAPLLELLLAAVTLLISQPDPAAFGQQLLGMATAAACAAEHAALLAVIAAAPAKADAVEVSAPGLLFSISAVSVALF